MLFLLTCGFRGIESRPNERGDKVLRNNVLSTNWEERSFRYRVYSSRVSLRDYSPNWRVAMLFFLSGEKIMQEDVEHS